MGGGCLDAASGAADFVGAPEGAMRRAAEVAVRSVKGYGADHCAVFAGGVTYFALVSLFPLTLFAMSVLGFVFQDPADQQTLVDNLFDRLPLDEEGGRDDLEAVVRSVVEARGTLGVIGLAGAAYSASALFGAIRASLNAVFKAERKRPFFVGKAVDLAQVLVFTLLLLLSVGVTFGIAFAERLSVEIFGEGAGWLTGRALSMVYTLVPVALSVAIFILLYTLLPARKVGRRNALAGGVVAALLFEGLKLAFAQYVTHFGNYDATYGTLGFLIVLLLFFNLSAQVMLLGAEVARAGFDMESGDPSERLKETGALLQRAVRFLPSPVGARIAVPVMPATPSPRGPAPARLTTAPGRPPGVEAAQAAERPGTLSGLLLIGGLVAVAVACFRKR